MSSVVIWRDEATGVAASWNKQGPYTVFVPLRIDDQGICDGQTTERRSKEAAIHTAREAARKRLEEMRSEDPRDKRFWVSPEREGGTSATHEVHDLSWFRESWHLDEAAFAAIDAVPITGTLRTMAQGQAFTVQRVK